MVTLPFALHIDPLPSLHYQAVPRNSSDVSLPSTAEEDPLELAQPRNSAIGNNLRLQPLIIQPPAHDLQTISFLLEHSRATEAVPHFAALLRLLATADDDPHFSALIDFFDARYDLQTGRLVGDTSTAPLPTRRPGRLARMVSRKRRTSSNNNGSSASRPSFSLGQSGHILSPTAEGDELAVSLDDDTMSLAEEIMRARSPSGGGAAAGRTAPQLVVGAAANRSVIFPVRLDLHNAGKGLCPPPPAPILPRGRGASESSGVRAGEGSGLRRILSPGSDHSSHDDSHDLTRQTSSGTAESKHRRSSTLQRILSSRRRSRRRDPSNGSAVSVESDAPPVPPIPSSPIEDSMAALSFDSAGNPLSPLGQGDSFDPVFLSSDEGHGGAFLPATKDGLNNEWAGSVSGSPDFLTLLRQASETALSLPSSAASPSSPSAKAKGKQAAEPGLEASHRPPSTKSSQHDDDAEFEDNIFSKCARGETTEEEELWWPAGATDPLPLAILSALAPAFGWGGVFELCYGPGSPGHASKQLRALGLAAAQANGRETQSEDTSTHARSFADWQRLFSSMSRWVELYEMTRIRGGLSREIGLDRLETSTPSSSPSSAPAQYTLTSSIPSSVVHDATTRSHAYRRRMGIPDGLPCQPDGFEPGDYRWSRQKLGSASVATATTLSAASLAHYFSAMAREPWVYEAAWELDYLEALVLKNPVIAERFPPPGARAVTALPAPEPPSPGDDRQHLLPRACPNPTSSGCMEVQAWREWLQGLEAGNVVTPVVSVQAWWTCIALLNEAGPQGLEVQILGGGEDWREVRVGEGERGVYI